MLVAWSPAQEVKFNHLEKNLFTVQCSCLGDWLKVEKGGPWLFRQAVVSIEEYDGFSAPETVDLNFFSTWVQIHKLPVGYRKDATIKNLIEKKVGKVIEIQLDVKGDGNFVRAKVRLDVRKPLARFVSISRGGAREVYSIKFEKMPRFCGACGYVGHSHLECGTGEFEEDKLKWGEFLKADRDSWFMRGFAGGRGGGWTERGAWAQRGRGRTDGRGREGIGRGSGDAIQASWRYNALAYTEGRVRMNENKNGENNGEQRNGKEGEEDDTASSPAKKDAMITDAANSADSGTKRQLDFDATENEDISLDVLEGKTPMLTDELEQVADITHDGVMVTPPNSNVENLAGLFDKDRKKRSKRDGAVSPSLGSVGSHEEPVRSQ
jgi:hypothetical protein